MLDLPRYLLGAADLLLLAGFAWLGGSALRSRLLPSFSGPPAALAGSVLALALLIWAAELLGSFGWLEPVPYACLVALFGAGWWAFLPRVAGRGGPFRRRRSLFRATSSSRTAAASDAKKAAEGRDPPSPTGPAADTPSRIPPTGPAGRTHGLATAIAALIAVAAVVHFGVDTRAKLLTGMTGFDTTWYHAPFAAGFFQTGNTWALHLIAPQFLAWFYPANAEIFHAAGMLAFGRDLLSPLLNLGWFAGCLLALWCIGRPHRVAPWSLALGAIALSLPALSDQAGEARNDIAGIFFLLAAVAVLLNAWRDPGDAVRGDGDGADSGAAVEPGGGAGRRGAGGAGRAVGVGSPATRLGAVAAGGPVFAGGATSAGPLVVVGLAAGLAAGTKLDFLPPAAVLVVGLAAVAPRGSRWRALWISGLAALAGGGYWYLRNLAHTGNPLPWFDHLGPISLPAPEQALGGREGHSVLGYLTDGGVWSSWFLPGLHHGLTILWPLLAAAALAGLLLAVAAGLRNAGPSVAERAGTEPVEAESTSIRSLAARRRAVPPRVADADSSGFPAGNGILAVAALAGLAAAAAWLIAPTSASGPEGIPRGFESGLRYLGSALVLGLALLPIGLKLLPIVLPRRLRRAAAGHPPNGRILKAPAQLGRRLSGRRVPRGRPAALAPTLALLLVIAIGYPIQRHYLRNRYANPSFAAPGLDAAFKWANSISNARIATTGTRQYPLYGRDLSNQVQFAGVHTPHGGFVPPTTCQEWRHLLNEGDYDYVIATRDRVEPGKPPYPPTARWTAGPWATVVLRQPPTVVYKLTAPLKPSTCP